MECDNEDTFSHAMTQHTDKMSHDRTQNEDKLSHDRTPGMIHVDETLSTNSVTNRECFDDRNMLHDDKQYADPDYERLEMPSPSKRPKLDTQSGKEATVRKITRILKQNFKEAVANKEKEIFDIDKLLHQARNDLDRLRACIVTLFYKHGLVHTPSQPTVHPAVKDMLKEQLSITTRSSPDYEEETIKQEVTLESPRNASVDEASPTRIRLNPTKPVYTSQSDPNKGFTTNRVKEKRKVIVGNVSKFLVPEHHAPSEQATHKWMAYVRGPREHPDISDVVGKVVFLLHPSYRPHDIVTVTEPPFHLTRRGWGEFPLRVQLHFQNKHHKKVDIIHNLKLDKTYTGLQTLGSETVVEIELEREIRTELQESLHAVKIKSEPTQGLTNGLDSTRDEGHYHDTNAMNQSETNSMLDQSGNSGDRSVKVECEQEPDLIASTYTKTEYLGLGQNNSNESREDSNIESESISSTTDTNSKFTPDTTSCEIASETTISETPNEIISGTPGETIRETQVSEIISGTPSKKISETSSETASETPSSTTADILRQTPDIHASREDFSTSKTDAKTLLIHESVALKPSYSVVDPVVHNTDLAPTSATNFSSLNIVSKSSGSVPTSNPAKNPTVVHTAEVLSLAAPNSKFVNSNEGVEKRVITNFTALAKPAETLPIPTSFISGTSHCAQALGGNKEALSGACKEIPGSKPRMVRCVDKQGRTLLIPQDVILKTLKPPSKPCLITSPQTNGTHNVAMSQITRPQIPATSQLNSLVQPVVIKSCVAPPNLKMIVSPSTTKTTPMILNATETQSTPNQCANKANMFVKTPPQSLLQKGTLHIQTIKISAPNAVASNGGIHLSQTASDFTKLKTVPKFGHYVLKQGSPSPLVINLGNGPSAATPQAKIKIQTVTQSGNIPGQGQTIKSNMASPRLPAPQKFVRAPQSLLKRTHAFSLLRTDTAGTRFVRPTVHSVQGGRLPSPQVSSGPVQGVQIVDKCSASHLSLLRKPMNASLAEKNIIVVSPADIKGPQSQRIVSLGTSNRIIINRNADPLKKTVQITPSPISAQQSLLANKAVSILHNNVSTTSLVCQHQTSLIGHNQIIIKMASLGATGVSSQQTQDTISVFPSGLIIPKEGPSWTSGDTILANNNEAIPTNQKLSNLLIQPINDGPAIMRAGKKRQLNAALRKLQINQMISGQTQLLSQYQNTCDTECLQFCTSTSSGIESTLNPLNTDVISTSELLTNWSPNCSERVVNIGGIKAVVKLATASQNNEQEASTSSAPYQHTANNNLDTTSTSCITNSISCVTTSTSVGIGHVTNFEETVSDFTINHNEKHVPEFANSVDCYTAEIGPTSQPWESIEGVVECETSMVEACQNWGKDSADVSRDINSIQSLENTHVLKLQTTAGYENINHAPNLAQTLQLSHSSNLNQQLNRSCNLNQQLSQSSNLKQFSNQFSSAAQNSPHLVTVYSTERGPTIQRGLREECVLLSEEKLLMQKILNRQREEQAPRVVQLPAYELKNFSSLDDLLHLVVKHFPLVQENTDRELHPYCADSPQQWSGWALAKRRAHELIRAVFVRRALLRILNEDSIQAKQAEGARPNSDEHVNHPDAPVNHVEWVWLAQNLPTNHEIVFFCRRHIYTPIEPKTTKTEKCETMPQTCLSSLSLADPLLDEGEELKRHKHLPDTSDVVLPDLTRDDVINILDSDEDEEDRSKPVVGGVEGPSPVKPRQQREYLPVTGEQNAVRDICSQIGVRFQSVQVASGGHLGDVTYAALGEHMLWQCAKLFMEILLRRTVSTIFNQNRIPKDITVQDVFETITNTAQFDFLSNSYLAARDHEGGT